MVYPIVWISESTIYNWKVEIKCRKITILLRVSGDGVVTATSPGVAAEEPFDGEP